MIPFSKLQITIFSLISVLIVGSTLTFVFFQFSKDKAGGFNSQNSSSNNISKNQNPSRGNSADSNSSNSLEEVQKNYNSKNNSSINSKIETVSLENCNLKVNFNQNYAVLTKEKSNLILGQNFAPNLVPKVAEFIIEVKCTENSQVFENAKNNNQKNSKFYNQSKVESVDFVSEYKSEIILERNNSGTGLAGMSETYYFLKNGKTYTVNFVTQGQNNQEKINYDAKNLISPLFPKSDLQIKFGTDNNSQNSTKEIIPQQKNTPIQPLIADAEHDVIVLEECDLAFRINKKFNYDMNNMSIFDIKLTKDVQKYTTYFLKLQLAQTDKHYTGYSVDIQNFNVDCANKNQFNAFDDWVKDSYTLFNQAKLSNSSNFQGIFNQEIIKQHKFPFTEYMENSDSNIIFATKDKYYNITSNIFTPLRITSRSPIVDLQINSLAPSTPSVKLANSDSQETKAQNETTTFKLANFSDESLKKVTLNNILEDSNMKDCLNKTTFEPIFKKEILHSDTLNKNYIKVSFGSPCTGNMGTNFGIIEVDSNGNASFLLKPNETILQDMKLYLSPNSDKITLEETYKFLGCSANTNISVMDLKTKKYIYDSFTNSTSTDIPAKTEKEQTIIQEKFSKWLDNDNLEILAKAKTADFGSHSGCNEFQDKALQTKIIKI